jgi:hypothetical protein
MPECLFAESLHRCTGTLDFRPVCSKTVFLGSCLLPTQIFLSTIDPAVEIGKSESLSLKTATEFILSAQHPHSFCQCSPTVCLAAVALECTSSKSKRPCC